MIMTKEITFLSKMVKPDQYGDNTNGFIKFKYFGEFEELNFIKDDCQDDMKYIGNSRTDGSPIFVYNYKNIPYQNIIDTEKLTIMMRTLKLKHYAKIDMTKEEKSTFTFFRFFMKACSDLHVKYVGYGELR